ncbi:MAG TPA: hypothetical protein VKA69_02995 [Desulfobacteria bacterium]|nr:hypothetical protein [Desulfobacteria bacterium]
MKERRSFLLWQKRLKMIFACLTFSAFCGCATPSPPRNPDNICEIFRENDEWYDDAADSYKKWGIPIPVMMAILHQESKYIGDAKPPRTTCLWIFPGPRPSSAYGYAQVLDGTWEEYRESTGNSWADRDDFGDAIDFVGWYCALSVKKCGISRNSARNLYLAYHEGRGGYNRRTYAKKAWLLRVANKVQKRAVKYRGQLAACEDEFRGSGCCLWPF